MPALHLATFASDATPPEGHPLCGGWIEPVRGVDDPLKALGVILLGMGEPIVLCVVDWTGIRNDANLRWCQALAKAAHTVPERVVVHSVHPHNAPFADYEAERLIRAAPEPKPSLDLKFFDKVVQQSAEAAQAALGKTKPFNRVGIGEALIEKVASNRRILGEDGKVKFTRTSATKNPEVRDQPEGLIDPKLKTVSFWQNDEPVLAMHYYATHPMSYYGDGRVSADFCGLARQKMQDEFPKVFQMYFTGCSGNVTAGKYNDGSKENRAILRDRMYSGMKEAWKQTKTQELKEYHWRSEPVKLPARKEASFGEEESKKALENPKLTTAKRNNAALQLAWLKRLDRPIPITCLDLGKVQIVHLPGEPFIEYQLKAQSLRKDATVCVAGYGDGGPGYVITSKAFFEGGYEPTVALQGDSEAILHQALAKVLQAK